MDKLTKDNVFQLFEHLTGLNNKIRSLNEEFPGDPLIEKAMGLNEKVLSYQAQVVESNGENIPVELAPLVQESYFAMAKAINRDRRVPPIKRLTRSDMLRLFPLFAQINGSMEKLVQDGSPLSSIALEAVRLNKKALTFQKQVEGISGETIPDELQSVVAQSFELMGLINLG